jgi:hypothetical protein
MAGAARADHGIHEIDRLRLSDLPSLAGHRHPKKNEK